MTTKKNDTTTTTPQAFALAPHGAGALSAVLDTLGALVEAEGLDTASLPEQTLPSLSIPTVQIDRPATAPARFWTKRAELSGYPHAQVSPRKLAAAGETGFDLGLLLHVALISYRERWQAEDDAGTLIATAKWREGAKRRAQVLCAVPVVEADGVARWTLACLTAAGQAAASLRAAYTKAVKARQGALRARGLAPALAALLPVDLSVTTAEPKAVPGTKKGETYTHAVISADDVLYQPAPGLGELLRDERSLVEEWTRGEGWSDVVTVADADDGDDSIPFGETAGA